MYNLNDKIKNLVPYEPITGHYNLRLDANESYFPLEQSLQEQLSLSTIDFNRYPDPYATDLCAAYGAYYHVDPALLTAGNGSDELIGLLVGTFLQQGQTLLTFSSDFSMYRFYGAVYGYQTLLYQKREDLTIDVDAVIALAKEKKVSCILFSNPCNPTSLGLSRKDVIKLITALDCLVVLDEAYMDFFGEQNSLLTQVQNYDNLIVLRTASKAMGIAGIRLGFAAANPTLTQALRAVKSPYNVNAVSQRIGTVLFSNPALLDAHLSQICANRDALYAALQAIDSPHIRRIYPTCTNFVFVKLDNAQTVFQKLLAESIAVRWMGEYLRITTGNAAQNEVLLEAFGRILAQ